jgi:hypothetical protein
MSGNGKGLDSDAIVIDPALPGAARYALQLASPGWGRAALGSRYGPHRGGNVSARDVYRAIEAYTAAGRFARLIPFQQEAPAAPDPPRPPRVMSAAAKSVRNSVILTLVFVGGTLLAVSVGSVVSAVVLLILMAASAIVGIRALFDAFATSWTIVVTDPEQLVRPHDSDSWYVRHATAYYHRRYVVPRTDMDKDAREVWSRAIAAAHTIGASEVVKLRLVDSVQVAAAMPQRLWEIAEGLARLTEARARQQESLRQAEQDDPYISVKVTSQERKLTLAADRIGERVRKLEDFAGLLDKADAGKHREATLERLGKVDDLLVDLLASTEGTAVELDQTERLRLEVQAVIEQANEAARNLVLPDEDDARVPLPDT